MAVPTVLIGCLPSYAQAGVAAPVLLALLRLVQGLAMGGEFGSALVRGGWEGVGGRGGAATCELGCYLSCWFRRSAHPACDRLSGNTDTAVSNTP
jgi:hypothetical protein